MVLRVLLILCMVIVMIIIAVSLHYQIGPSYLGLSKTSTSLQYIANDSNTMISMTSNRSSQYIWCVLHHGPNNQLRDFVQCCMIAIMYNYTLVIPPLFPHFRDAVKAVQWFGHIYDVKQLSLALNCIPLDKFISQNIKQKKVMIDCNIEEVELPKTKERFPPLTLSSVEQAHNINLVFDRYINLSRNFNMSELTAKAKDCSSIFLHINYLTYLRLFPVSNIYQQFIYKHFHRTPLIKRMASALIKLLPELVINRNHSKPKFDTLAVIHMRLGDHVVMNVSMYTERILYLIKSGVRFTHLHIMCPYFNVWDIKYLTKNLPIPFTATQHLLPHVRFLLDEYLFDVLEQEIAYQAPIFLASVWSSYSETILMQKVYQNKGTVYLLSPEQENPPYIVTEKNVKVFY